jgi:hypothetical protein
MTFKIKKGIPRERRREKDLILPFFDFHFIID